MESRKILVKRTEVPMGLIELKGTYKYSTRMPSPSHDKFLKRKHDLQTLLKTRPSKILNAIIDAASDEFDVFDSSLNYTNRYTYIMPSIPLDSFNNIEILGSMTYSKSHTWIYSLHDKLDYALSYLFATPLSLVRERLISNCKTLNIDYEILSYAFCSMNMKYLETINLQVFLGISDVLDSYIMNIIWNPQTCVYAVGDAVVSLVDPQYTVEERITTFMLAKVGYYLQMITNAIIMLFKTEQQPFVSSRNCMLTSKGAYNVVISIAGYSNLPILSIEVDSAEPVRLVPREAHELGAYNEDNWYNQIIQ